MATNMDVLVLERFVLTKDEQPNAQEHAIDEYLARFALIEILKTSPISLWERGQG